MDFKGKYSFEELATIWKNMSVEDRYTNLLELYKQHPDQVNEAFKTAFGTSVDIEDAAVIFYGTPTLAPYLLVNLSQLYAPPKMGIQYP